MALHMGGGDRDAICALPFLGNILNRVRPVEISRGSPVPQTKKTDERGSLLGLCTMMKILELLQNSLSRSETPRVHLFRDATYTMELARHKLPRNGYSKFLHPQSDLGK
jgi:hypothetical protein